MKNQILSLLLAAVMLFSTLTACGQPSSPGESALPSIPDPQRFFQRIADVSLSESDGTATYTIQSKKDLQGAVLAYCDLLTGEYDFEITFSADSNGDLTYHLCYAGSAGIRKTDTFDIMVNYFGNDHASTNGDYGASVRVKQTGRFEPVAVKQYSVPSASTPSQTKKPAATSSPSPSSTPKVTTSPSPSPSSSRSPTPSVPDPQHFFRKTADVTRSTSSNTTVYELRSKQNLEDAIRAYYDLLIKEYQFKVTFASTANGDLVYHFCYGGSASIQKTDTFDIMVSYFGNDHASTNGDYGASIRVKQANRFDLVSAKQYAVPSPSPSPPLSPTPSLSPSPSPSPTPAPEPEKTVDPSSKLLPDLEAFLYRSASSRSYFGDTGRWGRWLKWNGSHPYVAYETITQELLDLLLDERYQLKLTKAEFTPHYSNRAVDYYFEYTGTSEDITLLTDEKGEYTFHVRLRLYPYPEHDYFQFSFAYSQNFVLEDPGKRTTRNITKGGDGEIITAPPSTSSGSSSGGVPDSGNTFTPEASRLDCLTCRGDGDCNTCGGDGYTGFGSAKAGCRTCHGNGKCRACGGSGKR